MTKFSSVEELLDKRKTIILLDIVKYEREIRECEDRIKILKEEIDNHQKYIKDIDTFLEKVKEK